MFRSALRSSVPLLRSSRPARSFPSPTFARFISDNGRAQLQKAVTSSPVVLFMKGTPELPQCGFSRASVQILDLHAVPKEKMTTFNVLEDQQLRTDIKEFSDWPTIPQLYVNGEFVGGCDILIGMHQSGELATLLESKSVIPKTTSTVAEAEPASAS